MPQITLSNGRQFDAEPGTTLLDAALAQGLVLEHSCRTGRCGSCKAKVDSGQVAALGETSSLTADEASAGWVLTCAHQALTDVALDLEDLGALAGITVRTHPCRIAGLERLAPDVVKVSLRLPPTAQFRFLPGQYVDVTSPGGVRRSYSLASDAAKSGQLELHVRSVAGGAFSTYWFGEAKLNDLLRFQGPRGTFFLRDVAGRHVVFLATGTGIAPFCSMLPQLSALPERERPSRVSLYWGGRVPADLYMDPRLLHSGLHFVPVLSRAGVDWIGARGHVQDVAASGANDAVPDWTSASVYACGSEAMIESAKQKLMALGLAPKQFYADAFVSSN